MRAVTVTAAGLRLEEVPEPVPGHGQVLAEPLATGICGSDLHLAAAIGASGDAETSIVLGHEYCARVVDNGPGTSGAFPAGTRVVSIPYADGPVGPEGLGLSTVLPGGFAERMVLQDSFLLKVPDHLPDEHAALTEPLAVGVHAVNVGQVRPHESALVIGCGPIGLATIAALKAGGHGPVIAADFSPARRALAERLGADVVLDPASSSPYAQWADLVTARTAPSPLLPDDLQYGGSVVAFECVGVPGVIQQMIEGLPRHSRMVVVGVCMGPDTIVPVTAITSEISMSFVYAYRAREFADTLDMLARLQLDAASFITGRVGLDGVAGAFADLATPNEHIKIMVRPGDH